MFDRKNHDPKLISTFEIIGSYFVDVFYNSLYLKAKEQVISGNGSSITDVYKNNILAYTNAIGTRRDLYYSAVKSLHEYFQANSAYTTIIFSDFEDKVLCQFIPLEYYSDFTDKHKDSTLHNIIIRSVGDFAMATLEPSIFCKIIDDHMNRANVRYLQDKLVDIFILQREEYFTRFVQERTKHTETVARPVVDKIKMALVLETKKRCTAENERDKAINMIQQLTNRIKQLESELQGWPSVTPPPNKYQTAVIDKTTSNSKNDINQSVTARSFNESQSNDKLEYKSNNKSNDKLEHKMNDISNEQPTTDQSNDDIDINLSDMTLTNDDPWNSI